MGLWSRLLLLLAVDKPLLLVGIVQVVNAVDAAHEVWMVRVDVRVLDGHQVADHLVRRLETLHQERQHLVVDSLAQALESKKFRHLNLDDDAS